MTRRTCCGRAVVGALKVTNLSLFLFGFALLGVASWMWGGFINEEEHHGDSGNLPAPW